MKVSGKSQQVYEAMSSTEYMTCAEIDQLVGFRSTELLRGLLRRNLVRKRSIAGRNGAEYRKVRV